jgi:ABC-type branched-subunit amino acid transport system ATPase component
MPIIEKLLDEGKTMIVIEHRLKELFRIANNVIVLNFGKRIAYGPPADVISSDEVKKAYLGSEE